MLQGRLHIVCGEEGFESDRGPWTVLGAQSLQDGTYVADFSASPTERCRVLQISHADYQAGTYELTHIRTTHSLTRFITTLLTYCLTTRWASSTTARCST